MITIYVLVSQKDHNYYVGMTNNLQRRLHEHNSKAVKSTKSRTPFTLLYSELCSNRAEGRKREKYLKSAAGKAFLRKIIKQPSNLPD